MRFRHSVHILPVTHYIYSEYELTLEKKPTPGLQDSGSRPSIAKSERPTRRCGSAICASVSEMEHSRQEASNVFIPPARSGNDGLCQPLAAFFTLTVN